MRNNFTIPLITVNEDYVSVFSEESHETLVMSGMTLTNRIDAQNLRLRESEAGYKTDFHVAGDPTLIIIQQGCLRITLQNGDQKDFSAGDVFIAKDYLPQSVSFNLKKHGHKAEVIGPEKVKAVHVKLITKSTH